MKVLHINRNYLTSPLHQVMMDHLDKTAAESVVFAPTEDKALSLIQPNPNVIVSECFSRADRFFYGKKQRKIRKALESSGGQGAVADPAQPQCDRQRVFFSGRPVLLREKTAQDPQSAGIQRTGAGN